MAMKLNFSDSPISQELIDKMQKEADEAQEKRIAEAYVRNVNAVQYVVDGIVRDLRRLRKSEAKLESILKDLRDNPPANPHEAAVRLNKSGHYVGCLEYIPGMSNDD